MERNEMKLDGIRLDGMGQDGMGLDWMGKASEECRTPSDG